jgi:superfamily I DNA/RNA helicase
MGTLQIVRASAGSGKTHDLCTIIADEVVRGLDPARVLATTFTRKAAAELKGRIQAQILSTEGLQPRERIAKAERLELAAIGTVHSVGHQLVTRYALHLGLSPDLEILDEKATDRTLDALLGELSPEPWEDLARLTRMLSISDRPQALVLELLQLKRGNRIDDHGFRLQLEASVERLCKIMAPDGPTEDPLGPDDLYDLAQEALDEIVSLQDSTKVTGDAVAKLRGLVSRRTGKWGDFATAIKLKAGTRSGADSALQPLREAAARVLLLPQLHADIKALVTQIGKRVIELDQRYREFKADRGLVDFSDLEVYLLRLLEEPDLAESLAADFSFVAIDEFQDSNPLQLAIFQRLRAISAKSRWVGDAKQAIYGFRGTDPALVHGVWDTVPADDRSTLEFNWRSSAGLVRLVGKLFEPVLGDEVVQTPKRETSSTGCVERWMFQTSNKDLDAAALATGIARLRDEGVRLRDVAVLARTHADADSTAAACRRIGLPVLRELPGLLATRECALTLAGMRLAADRYDSLAAATILHITSDPRADTPAWLSERLKECHDTGSIGADEGESTTVTQRRPPWPDNAMLARLDLLDPRTLSPELFLQEVIGALDVPARLAEWGDAARRSANLDSLDALARSYEEEVQQRGSAPTVTGLITHLEELASDGKDIQRPPYGIDAVRIDTYHVAKGLEWPVVILTGLDFAREPDMWSPEVTGGDPTAADPLAGRSIRYWPWPFGRDSHGRRIKGTGLNQGALATPEGLAAGDRQRDEALRLLYVGFTRAKDRLILAHRQGKHAWLEELPEIDGLLHPDEEPGETVIKDIDLTYVLRHLTADDADEGALAPADRETWLERPTADGRVADFPPRYVNPSHAPTTQAEVDIEMPVEEVSKSPLFTTTKDRGDLAALGEAVHAYLAALPSLEDKPEGDRLAVASRCLRGFVAEAFLKASELVEMGDRVREWVTARYPGASWRTEVPVTARLDGGSQVVGTIDLLLELPGGGVVIIDHKAAPVSRRNAIAKAVSYAGQIGLYRAALRLQDIDVRHAWVHLPMTGVMVDVSGVEQG